MEALYENKIIDARKKLWGLIVWTVLLFAGLVASALACKKSGNFVKPE